MEITGYNPNDTGTHPFINFGYHNASYEWIVEAQNLGLSILDHPEEGTVLVTDSHVANVERYDEGQGWLISESGWDDVVPWHLWYSLYESGGHWYSSYATSNYIHGFIKIPGTGPGPGPTPPPGPHRKMPFIYYLKNLNNEY